MRKSRLINQLLVYLLLLISNRVVQAQSLIVWKADNSKEKIGLGTWPTIKRADAKLLIVSPEIELEYDINDVRQLTYEVVETGINELPNLSGYRQEMGKIVFEKTASNDRIALFTIGGVRLPVVFEQHGDIRVLTLTELPSGIYILDVNGSTIKIIKK